jgi:hypothetical protein
MNDVIFNNTSYKTSSKILTCIVDTGTSMIVGSKHIVDKMIKDFGLGD